MRVLHPNGSPTTYALVDEVFKYPRKPMPTGLHGFGAAAIGDRLYIAAGAKGRGGRDVTDELLVFGLP